MIFFTILLSMKLQAVILAAGKGARMKSDIPKPLIPVNGEPMLTTVLRTLADSEVAENPVIVVGAWTNAIQEHYGDRYTYATQTEINGTGGAVAAAIASIDTSEAAAPVLILYADTPFITTQSLQRLHQHIVSSLSAMTMYTVTLPDFTGWHQGFLAFGRVVRDEVGIVDKIVEYKVATEREQHITEVNPAVYCVKASWLKTALPRIAVNPTTGERYLTDLVELARADGLTIDTIPLSPKESFGFNSMADIENAQQMS